jgi:hypothetical protein
MQRVIDDQKLNQFPKLKPSELILGMDSTYFNSFCITVFRSTEHQMNLHWRESVSETLDGYLKGLEVLEAQGHKIVGVVYDNFKGLVKVLERKAILVQMCQWHVMKAIQRKTTLKPKTLAGYELLVLGQTLTKLDKGTFKQKWNEWQYKWDKYLNAKSVNLGTGELTYTHERLRSARRMIHEVMPNLFIYEDYSVFQIPKTNNGMEGTFSHLKGKVRVHRGLIKERKLKLIDQILKGPST